MRISYPVLSAWFSPVSRFSRKHPILSAAGTSLLFNGALPFRRRLTPSGGTPSPLREKSFPPHSAPAGANPREAFPTSRGEDAALQRPLLFYANNAAEHKIRALPEQAGNRSGVLSEPAQRRAAEGALLRGAQQYLYQIRSRPAAREKYDPCSAPVRRFYPRRPPGESALIAPSLCARRWA